VLALAVAVRARLLLFDEPDAYLDPENVRKFNWVIQQARDADIQVLIVTHKEDIFSRGQSLLGIQKF
jgi:ABC-type polar amino acid transport system ATPase subunit